MTTGFVHHEKYLWHDTGSAGLWIPAGGLIQPEAHAVMEVLSGAATVLDDPYCQFLDGQGGHELYPQQKMVIDTAAQLAAQI